MPKVGAGPFFSRGEPGPTRSASSVQAMRAALGALLSPMQVDLDAERRLALAVLERARRDVTGWRLTTREPPRVREAREWIDEGGPTFRHWCAVLGLEWRGVRDRLLSGEVESLSGVLTGDLPAADATTPRDESR